MDEVGRMPRLDLLNGQISIWIAEIMPKISVDTEFMATTSRQVKNSADSLVAQLQTFQSQVEGLLASGWSGPSADAFRGLVDQWLPVARQMGPQVTAMSEHIAKTGFKFEEADGSSTVR